MSTELAVIDRDTGQVGRFNPDQPVTFSVNRDEVQRLKAQYGELRIRDLGDKEGYRLVHEGRMACVRARSTVETQRKEFKAAALEYGRSVDAAAKAITAEIQAIERVLFLEEDRIDREKERIKREAEEAKQRKLQERLDKLVAVGAVVNPLFVAAMDDEEFEATLAEKTAEYNSKLAAMQAAHEERERQEAAEAERRREEEQRLAVEREQQRQEQQRLQAERAKLEAEQEQFRQHQAAALKAEQEKEAAARAEIERVAAEQRAKEEAERKAQEELAWRQRQEEMKPDREKLLAIAVTLESLKYPECATDEGRKCLSVIRHAVTTAANRVRDAVDNTLGK